MPHFSSDGVSIYYETHGHGPPLVLCHGLSGGAESWENQVPVLSREYQVITWDARGHGHSDSPKDSTMYSLDIFAQDLARLLDHLGIDRACLAGHSMGGGVALRFAMRNPQRVIALLIIDSFTASGLPTPPDTRAMREKSIELALSKGMDAVVDHSLQSNANVIGRVRGSDAEAQAMRQRYAALDPHGYANSVRTILDNGFPDEWWSRITFPTLVMVGEDDTASIEATRYTHLRIPGSRYVIIKKAGHMAYLDQTEEFNRNVLDFLREAVAART